MEPQGFDLMSQVLEQIKTYFYLEYTFTVWGVTATIRYLCTPKEGDVPSIPATPFTNIDRFVHPKWLTFLVAVIVGAATKAFKVYADEPFVFFKAVCSLGLATLGYDYIGKPLWDKIRGKNPLATKPTNG
jgi:hypothetical protein